jgi:hypothetical protein
LIWKCNFSLILVSSDLSNKIPPVMLETPDRTLDRSFCAGTVSFRKAHPKVNAGASFQAE